MSLFFHFLVRFNSETNHFVPVSISFIIIEYSLNMYIIRDFSKISFSIFTLYPSPKNSSNIPNVSEFNEIRQGS